MKNQPSPTIKDNESFVSKVATTKGIIVLGLIFIVCLAMIGVWILDVSGASGGTTMNTQNITGVFIDINGDGLVDYVTSAEVIINNGGASFPSNQPKNP